ncbi:MAG: DUF6101 family protein [Pseudolabrys sp.]
MSGGCPAGSSRALRLDPFALPARFEASDSAADGQVRQVELYRERVVMRRAVRGMRMALNMPVSAFRGVSIRMLAPSAQREASVSVVLEHRDPALALPLYVSSDGNDISAEWRTWGEVLGLPLLVANGDGSSYEPFARIGGVRLECPQMRRRRRSTLKRRRPTIPLRRAFGKVDATMPVHRAEREIIARN